MVPLVCPGAGWFGSRVVADYYAILGTLGKLGPEPMLLNFFWGQSDRREPEPTGEGVFQISDGLVANSQGAQKDLELLQRCKMAASYGASSPAIRSKGDRKTTGQQRVPRDVEGPIGLLSVHAGILAHKANFAQGPEREILRRSP